MKNTFAPINRIPPEVLTLIPDWDIYAREQCAIKLSHVCQAWRESFISRASLWTHFDCADADKTRVYLERSKSSPINLWLDGRGDLSLQDPLFRVIPHATGRLKYVHVHATPKTLQDITPHLSHPVPLLEYLSIQVDSTPQPENDHNPALTAALFSGDLSSLRELDLRGVGTELPWRKMDNLTSFTLGCTEGRISIRQFLDFFESAPRLREIKLHYATPTSGAQDGRLVSLACLKEMEILGNGPCSLLLNHLLIPVGAELETRVVLLGDRLEGHLPDSLDNLGNLSNFTKISLQFDGPSSNVQFTGPSGDVSMTSYVSAPRVNLTCLTLEYLARFDTSKVEWLEIDRGDPLSSRDYPYQALLPMQNLRTLTLSQCDNLYGFTSALHPSVNPLEPVVCPKLDELTLDLNTYADRFQANLWNVIGMAAMRASRGAKLKSVIINTDEDGFVRVGTSELKEHVLQVEYNVEADAQWWQHRW